MIILAQFLMHLTEPFLHRYIIRGTFDPLDSHSWHTKFVHLWITIYLFGLACFYMGGGCLTFIWIVTYLFSAICFRFTMQSVVLNKLMIEDKFEGRTWHTLRNEGVDKKVVDFIMFFGASRKTAQKIAIYLGVALTVTMLITQTI